MTIYQLSEKQRMTITIEFLQLAYARSIELGFGLDIRPCATLENNFQFRNSITEFRGHFLFWFNTPDNGTHVVRIPLSRADEIK